MTSNIPTVPIVFSTDNNYAGFTASALLSMCEYCSPASNYDVIILYETLSDLNKALIRQCLPGLSNISLRFIDIAEFYDSHPDTNFVEWAHFTRDAYNRLVAPDLLPEYGKVLYLDSDIIVQGDVAELFNTDVGNNYLGACIDHGYVIDYNSGLDFVLEHYKRNLVTTDPAAYFNSGVLVMNLDAMRQDNIIRQCIDALENITMPSFADQDVLNRVCHGRVSFISPAWNYMWHIMDTDTSHDMSYLPDEERLKLEHASGNFHLIHYSSNFKPWEFPGKKNAHLFWNYARQTPFYESILKRHISKTEDDTPDPLPEINSLLTRFGEQCRDLQMVLKIREGLEDKYRKSKFYRFRKLFSWGKRREKYNEKISRISSEIRKAEKIIAEKWDSIPY